MFGRERAVGIQGVCSDDGCIHEDTAADGARAHAIVPPIRHQQGRLHQRRRAAHDDARHGREADQRRGRGHCQTVGHGRRRSHQLQWSVQEVT